jgi:hypothetical protein
LEEKNSKNSIDNADIFPEESVEIVAVASELTLEEQEKMDAIDELVADLINSSSKDIEIVLEELKNQLDEDGDDKSETTQIQTDDLVTMEMDCTVLQKEDSHHGVERNELPVMQRQFSVPKNIAPAVSKIVEIFEQVTVKEDEQATENLIAAQYTESIEIESSSKQTASNDSFETVEQMNEIADVLDLQIGQNIHFNDNITAASANTVEAENLGMALDKKRDIVEMDISDLVPEDDLETRVDNDQEESISEEDLGLNDDQRNQMGQERVYLAVIDSLKTEKGGIQESTESEIISGSTDAAGRVHDDSMHFVAIESVKNGDYNLQSVNGETNGNHIDNRVDKGKGSYLEEPKTENTVRLLSEEIQACQEEQLKVSGKDPEVEITSLKRKTPSKSSWNTKAFEFVPRSVNINLNKKAPEFVPELYLSESKHSTKKERDPVPSVGDARIQQPNIIPPTLANDSYSNGSIHSAHHETFNLSTHSLNQENTTLNQPPFIPLETLAGHSNDFYSNGIHNSYPTTYGENNQPRQNYQQFQTQTHSHHYCILFSCSK